MNTENDLVTKQEAEEWKLHRMAKVHNFLEMWEGSQNLHATKKESRSQNKQMTAIGYILDTEEMVKASWSLFEHDCAAVFKLLERPPLPPALSTKDLPGGWTQMLNVRQIRRINHHPLASGEDSIAEIISDTENWLILNVNLENPNDSEDDCAADDQSHIDRINGIKKMEWPQQRDVRATTNVSWLFLPTWILNREAWKVLVTVNAMKTRRSEEVNIK